MATPLIFTADDLEKPIWSFACAYIVHPSNECVFKQSSLRENRINTRTLSSEI